MHLYCTVPYVCGAARTQTEAMQNVHGILMILTGEKKSANLRNGSTYMACVFLYTDSRKVLLVFMDDCNLSVCVGGSRGGEGRDGCSAGLQVISCWQSSHHTRTHASHTSHAHTHTSRTCTHTSTLTMLMSN